MELPDGTIRKRLRRWEAGQSLRYLTFSTYRRAAVFGSAGNRDLFVDALDAARARYDFALLAWVVMPDHVHLILTPRSGSVAMGEILRSIKQPVARRIINEMRRQNDAAISALTTPSGEVRVWQEGGGFDRNIRDDDEYAREVAYIHHNPVKRGLVEKATDWAWSSARWYEGLDATIEMNSAAQPWGRVERGTDM